MVKKVMKLGFSVYDVHGVDSIFRSVNYIIAYFMLFLE